MRRSPAAQAGVGIVHVAARAKAREGFEGGEERDDDAEDEG